MKFKLLQAHEYHSMEEVDYEALPKYYGSGKFEGVPKPDADTVDAISADESGDNAEEEETIIIVGDIDDADSTDADSAYEGEAIDEDLSEKGKKTVNMTAQYIVYSVIIIMAIAFSIGICLLIYWWCCRAPTSPNDTMNPIGDGEEQEKDDNISTLGTIDERVPFVDIRSPNTIERAKRNHYVNAQTVSIRPAHDRDSEHEELLQNQRSNVYDDINGADEDEDGDDMIAHYGSTSSSYPIGKEHPAVNNSGYVIRNNVL